MKYADDIIRAECAAAGISLYRLKSASRWRGVVAVRRRIAARLRAETELSLPEIGRHLNRHHSAVLRYLKDAAA